MNNGYADVPAGAEEGARWNYLLSVNLGEHTFSDVEVKFGLDFDPAPGFDPNNLEASYTVFGSFEKGLQFVSTDKVDYANESIFQDSQNFDFGFWSDLLSASGGNLTRPWVFTTLVFTCTRWKRPCWSPLKFRWRLCLMKVAQM